MDKVFVVVADIVHAVLTRDVGMMIELSVSHDKVEQATDYVHANDVDFVSFHASLEEAEEALSKLQETEVRGLFSETKKEILLERKRYVIMSLSQGQNLAYIDSFRRWHIGEKILPPNL